MLNGEQIFELLEGIDATYLIEAQPSIADTAFEPSPKKDKASKKSRIPNGAWAAMLCVVIGLGVYIGILTSGFGLMGENPFASPAQTETFIPPEPVTEHPCAMGHTVETWTESRSATCYQTGLSFGVCSVCGIEQTHITPKIPHTFENGDCSVCGLAEGSTEIFRFKRIEGKNEAMVIGITTTSLYKFGYDSSYIHESNTDISYPNHSQTTPTIDYENILIPNVYYDAEVGFIPVTCIGDSALSALSQAIKITLPESITHIGTSAFARCTQLETVILPSTPITFGNYTFSDCTHLKTLQFAQGQTTLSQEMFSNCSSLENITLPQGLTEIPRAAFVMCTALQTVEIPDSVTSIENFAFWGCSSLQSAKLPDTLLSIGDSAFMNCTSLTKFVFPASVKNVSSATIKGCTGLQEITMYQGYTSINANDFEGFTQLRKLHLPAGVTQIDPQAFAHCPYLEEVTFAEGHTKFQVANGCVFNPTSHYMYIGLVDAVIPNDGSVTIIKAYAFAGRNIQNIQIPTAITKIQDYVFSGCTQLTSVTFPAMSVTSEGMFAGCTSLKEVIFPEESTLIPDKCFQGCTSLDIFVIPEHINIIGEEAFSGCSSLREVTFLGTPYIQANPFAHCYQLETVYYAGTKTQWQKNSPLLNDTDWLLVGPKLTVACSDGNIIYVGDTSPKDETPKPEQPINPCANGHATYQNGYCTACGMIQGAKEDLSIKRIEGKREAVITGWGAPKDISGEIILPNVYFDKTYGLLPVTHIGEGALSGRGAIQKIVLPSTLTHIGDRAFENCTALEEIVFPDGLLQIGEAAFMYCYALKEANLPDSVFQIGEQAFDSCESLTSFKMPASLEYASSYMLTGCTSISHLDLGSTLRGINYFLINSPKLTSIHIPASLAGIESSAFAHCQNLKDITVDEDNPAYISYGNLVIDERNRRVVFGGCEVEFPTDITIEWISAYAFMGRAVQSIQIPSTVKQISDYAFAHCPQLKSITFTSNYCSIAQQAFYSCDLLEEVKLSKHATINKYAFANCSNLKRLYVQYNNIGLRFEDASLGGCDQLTDIYYTGTCEQWQTYIYNLDNALPKPYLTIIITVHCSDGDIRYTR